MFTKILVPCDVSYETSDWLKPTVQAASELAEKYGAHVTFLTVVPENLIKGFYPEVYEKSTARDALARLESIVQSLVSEPSRASCIVREGGICPEIINAAKELSVDLIVLASHGPLIRDYLLGSNATHVALHVPCSVLILRPT